MLAYKLRLILVIVGIFAICNKNAFAQDPEEQGDGMDGGDDMDGGDGMGGGGGMDGGAGMGAGGGMDQDDGMGGGGGMDEGDGNDSSEEMRTVK
ncbi:hypothetical protein PV328_007298 [Microctonus aethiopoides]|uniref:Uncharacterized protein n=1 Tax=Microctonus aethiopoides TaxID=144406 RepID=A0AA39KUG0_9HYME|nr:hypothetical protein PV328_007298 [Microctonus aethiopoides]